MFLLRASALLGGVAFATMMAEQVLLASAQGVQMSEGNTPGAVVESSSLRRLARSTKKEEEQGQGEDQAVAAGEGGDNADAAQNWYGGGGGGGSEPCDSLWGNCDCGMEDGDPCCAKRDECAPGLVCVLDTMQGTQENGWDTSSAGVCKTCGLMDGQPCCEEHKCDHGLVCNGITEMCEDCGGPPVMMGMGRPPPVVMQPCCPDRQCNVGLAMVDMVGTVAPLTCNVDNKCDFCGLNMMQCCPGMKCYTPLDSSPALVCTVSGMCMPCGAFEQPCCDSQDPTQGCLRAGNICNANGFCVSGV